MQELIFVEKAALENVAPVQYESPCIEVIEIELEGVIAASGAKTSDYRGRENAF